jgi:hypothetical protein
VHLLLVLVQVERNLGRVRAALDVAGVRSELEKMLLDMQGEFAPAEQQFATHVAREVPMRFSVLLQLSRGGEFVQAPVESALDSAWSGRQVGIGVANQELGTFETLPAQLALVLMNLGRVLEGEQLFVRQTFHLNIQFTAPVDASSQVLLQFRLAGKLFAANLATVSIIFWCSEIRNIIYISFFSSY